MNETQDLSNGEIRRSLERIEAALALSDLRVTAAMARLEVTIGLHETSIQLLKQNRSVAIWILNGAWALILVVIEYLLHGRAHP